MAASHEFKQLVVQPLPDAGLIVRFRQSRIVEPEHIEQSREELLSLVAPERLLLLDFTNVEYVTSAVIGALIATQRQVKRLAGTISICGLHPQFEDLFRVLRLDRSFEIYPDLESALGGSSGDHG